MMVAMAMINDDVGSRWQQSPLTIYYPTTKIPVHIPGVIPLHMPIPMVMAVPVYMPMPDHSRVHASDHARLPVTIAQTNIYAHAYCHTAANDHDRVSARGNGGADVAAIVVTLTGLVLTMLIVMWGRVPAVTTMAVL